MSPFLLLSVLIGYFALLITISWIATLKNASNASFFTANRQSSWYLVAFGMIGASVSGISFVSVPGMVQTSQFTYLQMVLGFFVGYLLIAYLLLPLYYRLRLTSIYEFLHQRYGKATYKTGASFFVVAKLVGAASKLYVAILVLQQFLFSQWHVPFYAVVALFVFLIWIYTHRGGIRVLVLTDCIQTLVLLVALVLILKEVCCQLNIAPSVLCEKLLTSPECRVFVFDDWHTSQNFFKQFFSGIFVVVVMTGLDQDMMQKNLTCRSLKEAQRNMLSYGSMFLPVNFLFLVLGFLLLMFAAEYKIALPAAGDEILPFVVSSHIGGVSLVLFLLGMVAASFSSADSALTSITTTVFVDLLGIKDIENEGYARKRNWIHIAICVLFFFVVLAFDVIKNESVLDLIYTIVGYLYGPLLGLYSFALCCNRKVYDRAVPFLALLSPLLCYGLKSFFQSYYSYSFGYELLMINGLITFVGLLIFSKKSKNGNNYRRIYSQQHRCA